MKVSAVPPPPRKSYVIAALCNSCVVQFLRPAWPRWITSRPRTQSRSIADAATTGLQGSSDCAVAGYWLSGASVTGRGVVLSRKVILACFISHNCCKARM